MYNVYEVYTWDDVDYRKVASFEKESDAFTHCDLLNKEHREKAKETMILYVIAFYPMLSIIR